MRVRNHKIEDRILLKKAARDRCHQSLAIIYRKHRLTVYDYLKRAGADGMAEDICQTVFVRLCMGKYNNYAGQTAADDYLCTVARNILRNHRKVKAETAYPPNQIDGLNAEQTIDIQQDSLETAEEHQRLNKLIAELPPKSRQAIELALKDIGKGRGAIWTHAYNDPDVFRKRLRYAIKLLREKIINS